MSYENIPKNTDNSAVAVEIIAPKEVSNRGTEGIPVFLQDQTTDVLDLYFLQEKVTGLTLAADTVIGSRQFTLTSGHGLTTANSAGHFLELADVNTNVFYQSRVISVAGDVVTCSSAINTVYTVADTIANTGNPNLVRDAATGATIDGSVTPAVFTVKPLPTQSGDITRIVFASTSTNDMDFTTLGGASALSLGLLLRVKKADGTYKNIFNYKANFDIIIHGYDHTFLLPKGGGTTKGFVARVSFAGQDKHGVAIRLDGSLGEELQLVVSELMDSTAAGNLSFSAVAEGSELQG